MDPMMNFKFTPNIWIFVIIGLVIFFGIIILLFYFLKNSYKERVGDVESKLTENTENSLKNNAKKEGYCPNCGSEIEDPSTLFCSYCGTKLSNSIF